MKCGTNLFLLLAIVTVHRSWSQKSNKTPKSEDHEKEVEVSRLREMSDVQMKDDIGTLSEEKRDGLCKRALTTGATKAMLTRLKASGADCIEALRRDRDFKASGGEAEAVMKQLKEEKPPKEWDESDWSVALRQMPGAVKAVDLKTMSKNTTRKLIKSGDMQKAAKSMKRPSQKRAFVESAKNIYGEASEWTDSDLVEMGEMLSSIDTATLKQIPKDKMKSAASSFKELDFDDLGKKAAAGRKLVEALGKDSVSSWTSDDVKNADQYIRKNPAIISKLSDEAIRKSLKELGSRKTDTSGATQLGRRLIKMEEFKDPQKIDKSKVEEMGQLMKGMGKEYLKDVPMEALEGALDTLANVSFEQSEAREIVKKIKGIPSEFTSDKVKQLGELINGLEPEDFEQMPDSAIVDSLDELKDKEFDVSQCRAIVKKAKSAGKANMKRMGKLMSKCMGPSDIEDSSLEDLGLDCKAQEAPSIDMDKAQAKEMFKKIKERFGDPTRDNRNYTLQCMRNWGRAVALGMEPGDLENLPDNGDLDSVFETLAEHDKDMDLAQTEALSRRLRAHLDMDNDTVVALVGEERIEKCGTFMKHFNDKDLEKFEISVRPAVAQKLGESSQQKSINSETRRLKNFALKFIRRDDIITDRRSSPSLDNDDIMDLGTLFAGLDENDVKKMDKETIISNMVDLNGNVRSRPIQEALLAKASSEDRKFLNDPENIIGLAGFAGSILPKTLATMDRFVLGEALADSAHVMTESRKTLKERDEAGFNSDISLSDRDDMEKNREAFVTRSFDGYMEIQSTEGNRKKRNIKAITCRDVKTLGDEATSLSSKTLMTLSTRDFKDCSEFLGSLSSWKQDQLNALVSLANSAYGDDVASWTPQDVRVLGSIVAGLNASDIMILNLNSSSILTNLGKSSALSFEQLEAGALAFLKKTYGGDIKKTTDSDLMSLGNLVCGFNANHIPKISSEAFRAAVSAIGKLTTCPKAQMESFAILAKNVYGPVTNWNTGTITTVGTLIGGVSPTEFSSLNSKQLQTISTISLPRIPSDSFARLTCSQIGNFTRVQMNVVTVDQKATLSPCSKEGVERHFTERTDNKNAHTRGNDSTGTEKPSGPEDKNLIEKISIDDVVRPILDRTDNVNGSRNGSTFSPPGRDDSPIFDSSGVDSPQRIIPDILPTMKDIGGIKIDPRKTGMDMLQLKEINESSLEVAINNMNITERDEFCQRAMRGGADDEMMKKLKRNGADCLQAMKKDPNFKPEGSQAEVAMKQMREEKPPQQWDKSDWSVALRQMPGAVKADDLKEMSPNTTKMLVANGDLSRAMSSFKSTSEKRALDTQLKDTYGQPDAWSKTDLEELGDLLGSMPPSTLKKIPKENVKAAAASFKDIEFEDRGKKAAAGNQLIEGLGKDTVGQWSAEDVKNADQYIRNNPAIVSKLSNEAIKTSLRDLGARKTDKRGAAQIGKRLKSMTEYRDPTAIDSTKLTEMSQLMQGMGREYLSQLPENAIQGAISTLANVSFPRGEAKELVDKLRSNVNPSRITADGVKNLGELVIGFEAKDFDEMPASAIAESIDDLSNRDFDVSQCRSIIKKAKSASKSNMKKMGKLMSKCMTPDDVKDADLSDLGLNCDSDTPPSFTPDKAQAKEMFKKIKEKFGSPSETNTNYTLSCMKNWGRVAALGMEPQDLENLPDNGDLDSVFETLSKYEADMDDSQTKSAGIRLKRHLNLDNATEAAQIDSSRIDAVGKFLKDFDIADLEKFNETIKPDIARKLGEANHAYHLTSVIVKQKDFALKNVKRDGTNKIEDRRTVNTLDDNDVRDLGNLFSGLEESDVLRMDNDSMQTNLGSMNGKIRNKNTLKAVWSNIGNNSDIMGSPENIISASCLSGGMSENDLLAITKGVLAEALSDSAVYIEECETVDQRRDSAGFRDEIPSIDREQITKAKQNFIKKGFEGYQEAQTTTSRRRRKRATSVTLTCSEVQVLGSNAVTLTTSQLEALSTTEFKDCTETLGGITSWSSEQLTTLASEAKAAYNQDSSTWSPNDVKLLGTITAGLTATEIGNLNITSASILTTMGTSTAYTSSQLSAGFGAFLQRTYGGVAENVIGDDLMIIGNFVCGAETTQISKFNSSEYSTAASSIGKSTSCDASQLSAYATLAKSAYGATSSWDSAAIVTVGSVIGGLTKDEIGALTSQQIASISATSITQIPSTSFVGFSTTQLSGFTASQANSVTATQQVSMSQGQRDALVSAGATIKDTGTGSTGTAGSTAVAVKATLATIISSLVYTFV